MPSDIWRARKPSTTTRWSLRRARRIRMAIQLAVIAIFFLIILPAFMIYKPPRVLINYFVSRFPDVLIHVGTSKKIVALTIDDTPSIYTPEILSILKEHDATATFFVIGGQVAKVEDQNVLADIVRQGNELGNHAMHDEPSISLDSETLFPQIHQVDSIINQAYKQAGRTRQSALFRPGSGFFSQRLLDVVARSNYRTVLGDIFPHDPFVPFWRLNAWHILSSINPGGIIICHDRRSWTAPMLKKVLVKLKRKGYKVVTVSELLAQAAT